MTSKFILYICTSSVLITILYTLFNFYNAKNNVLDEIRKNNSAPDNTSPSSQDNNKNDNRQNKFAKRLKSIATAEKNIVPIYQFFSTAVAIFTIFFLIQSFTYTAASTTISEFEYKLKIIQYKVHESEIKKIEYHWATMQNRSDYNKVNKLIQNHLDSIFENPIEPKTTN